MTSGDTIEFGLSAGFKHQGTEWWVKTSGGTTIRPGESEDDAKLRLVESVTDFIDNAVEEITERK